MSQDFESLEAIASHLRVQLEEKRFLLLYAYNGTGKTRLSMAFKDLGKRGESRDTLYFNAFTEDLFYWDNDLEEDSERKLRMHAQSHFFDGLNELELESKISEYLLRYCDFNFKIDYENKFIRFYRDSANFIKVSRGEENLFIWCMFLAICKLALEGEASYAWVKYIYIDDPISSLDDNNAIAVASDLAQLLKKNKNKARVVVSSHHALFFNVMWNELKEIDRKKFTSLFMAKNNEAGNYSLKYTGETPYFYHVALLGDLHKAAQSGNLYTYHFNILRSLLEKTATFHGFNGFAACIKQEEDDTDGVLHARIINILSHGNYSLYEPMEMVDENKTYFRKILNDFLTRFPFNPTLFEASTEPVTHD